MLLCLLDYAFFHWIVSIREKNIYTHIRESVQRKPESSADCFKSMADMLLLIWFVVFILKYFLVLSLERTAKGESAGWTVSEEGR